MKSEMTVVLAASLLLAIPAQVGASHAGDCHNANDVASCSGGWLVPHVVNPGWWDTSSVDDTYDHTPENNQAIWLHVVTEDASHAPFEVEVSIRGPVVASLDIYRVERGFGPAPTNDHVTPRCPQGYALWAYPEGDEGAGSPSHLNRVQRLVLVQHIMIGPDAETIVDSEGEVYEGFATIDLPRDEEWAIVVDGRLGTSMLDDDVGSGQPSIIQYSISTADGTDFDSHRITEPDRPVDSDTWSSNGEDCLDDIPDPPA